MRINLFVWKVVWDYLPAKYISRDRGINLPPTYAFYKLDVETVEHVLFLCLKGR